MRRNATWEFGRITQNTPDPVALDHPTPDNPRCRSFFPLPPPFSSFCLSLWGSVSLNFGGVFEGRDPEMCTLGLQGCRVEPRRLRASHDSPRSDPSIVHNKQTLTRANQSTTASPPARRHVFDRAKGCTRREMGRSSYKCRCPLVTSHGLSGTHAQTSCRWTTRGPIHRSRWRQTLQRSS